MYHVLVFGMTENPGGVESFLMNYYRQIDKKRIQFDFLANSHNPIAYEDEVRSMGAKVYHIAARSRKPLQYVREMTALFQHHSKNYDAIWVNVSSLANIDYLREAKKYGIPRRIIHSHNSRNMDSRMRGLLHQMNRKKIADYATDFWACSEDAAKWFYTGEVLDQAVIIHNAIDVDRLAYEKEAGERVRANLGIPADTCVLGNIGRLHFQKNQMFALDVFQKFYEKRKNSRLVLVGQGEDLEKLKRHAEELQISDAVIFTGVQSDIRGFLSSFDLFLFPSLFEGLSIAALEAQANGLPVLASNGVIPKEVRINSNFRFLSLKHSAEEWAEAAGFMLDRVGRVDRVSVKNGFIQKGYEISAEAKRLEQLFDGKVSDC